MRLVSIASGSSGNSTYIGSEETHLLVDAGISCRKLEKGLEALGIRADELNALVVTHEHNDHIRGISVFLKHHRVPVYATEGTLRAMREARVFEQVPDAEELLHGVTPDSVFRVGDIDVLPFSIDHDAAEPAAYRFRCNGKACAVATDLGQYTEETVRHLKDLDALLLESNHDVRMLEAGPYPYSLKRRILGKFGHLSNEDAGRLLSEVLNGRLQQVVLGHLSRENNLPELARETVRDELSGSSAHFIAEEVPIAVARRDAMSDVFEF